jgi:hypothetical protein
MMMKRNALTRAFPFLILVFLPLATRNACRGQEVSERATPASSLSLVPADAAFYYASMNHRPQIDAVLESRAWEQLMYTRVAKQMRKAYRSGLRRGWNQFGPGNPFAGMLEAWSESVGSPAGSILMTAIQQILANEVFLYADANYTVFSEATGRFAARIATLNDLDEEEIGADILAAACEEFEGLALPTIVFGAVLDEPEGIKSLLATMDIAVSGLLENLADAGDPFLSDAYEVLDEPGLFAVTFSLNGDELPWESLENGGELSDYLPDLKRLLKGKTLSVAVAVKDRFLIAMVAPDLEPIRNPEGGSLLIDDPRFAEIRQSLEERQLTHVFYDSASLASCRRQSWIGLVDSATSMLSTLLRQSPEGRDGKFDAMLDELIRDAPELRKDIDQLIPEAEASLSWSYLTESGYAGKALSWSGTRYAGDSAPLKLLRPAGPSTLLLNASRDKDRAAQFAIARKWCDRAIDYLVGHVPDLLPEHDRAEFLAFVDAAEAPVRSALGAISQDLVPAMDNGEFLFVLDLEKGGEHWHRDLPESGKPGPIPIVSMVVEINDEQKVRDAGQDLFNAATEMVDALRQLPNNEIPESFRIELPLKESVNGFERRYWALPGELGLDSDIQPHLMLGENLLGVSLSLSRLEALMDKGRSEPDSFVSGNAGKPLVSAVFYNHSALVDALRQWVDYGLAVGNSQGASLEVDTGGDNEDLHFSERDIRELIDAGFSLFGCFKSYSSTTRIVDGVWVTETETRFSDIEAPVEGEDR